MHARFRPPPHHAHRLVRWQRLAFYAIGALLLLTGCVWLAIHYSIGAGAGELPHPLEVWSLRIHGLAAFGGLFMLGVLAAAHVPQGWRLSHRRRWAGQRATGIALCGLGALLALTGYALYYFAPEAVRPALGWVHAGVGAAMGVMVASHRRGGGQSVNPSPADPAAGADARP
jgi:hypothetical protein